MEPRFLKWMGETLCLYAANIEALENMVKATGVEKAGWSKFSDFLPMTSPPPFSADKMDKLYREWLSFAGAVPKSDVEALQEKIEALEEECDQLRQSMDMLVQGLSGVRQIPAAMTQWVDFAKTMAAVHREWFDDFRRHWGESVEKEGRRHGRRGKKLE